jgi:hypothetical protein
MLRFGMSPLLDDQIERLCAGVLDVGAGRIEVVVVGHDLAHASDQLKQDTLRRPPLVRRDDVSQAGQLPRHVLELVEAASPRVTLVRDHHRAPLRRRHRGGSAVGQQIDQDVLGMKEKGIMVRAAQDPGALIGGGEADRLHHLDLKRLDDRLHRRPCSPRER